MAAIKRAALVGGGVIGAGWAARFLLNGIDVAVYDPDPEIGRKLDTVTANARRAWGRLLPGRLGPEGRLSIAPSVAAAVDGADFVQESLPEREDLKQRVLAEIDRGTRPDVIIASSTSGLLPTRLQAAMARPERFVVGHPFNPVYLLPLVEVCGGAATAADTGTEAAAFYRRLGMQPLMIRKEVDGFVADRLLEALWREALWLVNDSVATTAEIDDAIRYGAGLRWAFMGTFLTYRLAGGEAGMRHFLAQFGPALKLPWTRLEAPELTEALIDAVSSQSDDQAAGISIRELERRRDDCLVALLGALRSQDYAAGATLKAYEAALPAIDETRPLRLHRATVLADWIDYNGHMTEHRYLQVFGDATDAVLRHVGADADYVAAGHSYYTAQTSIAYAREVREGVAMQVTSQVLGADDKRLHLFHSLLRADDGTLLATAETMLVHVDTRAGGTCPALPGVLAAVRRLAAAQAGLERPAGAGRPIALPVAR